MGDLFGQLGIDWRLLISQAANFIILLVILRLFVYGPLMKVLAERRDRIAEGLAKADEADTRLSEVNEIAKGKLKEADAEAQTVIHEAKQRGVKEEEKMRSVLAQKEAAGLSALDEELARKKVEANKKFEDGQAALVREALIKTVGLSPDAIDDALISQAIREVRK
ncbi:MAG: hypothetical protein KBD16_03605 [Candidatus Pacebacteria bacterium]|nr:hypothetical protein [Candidatus Paceibacterota bacterium]